MAGFSFPNNSSSSSSPFSFSLPSNPNSSASTQPSSPSPSPSLFAPSSSSLFSSPNPIFGAPASSTPSFSLSANAASSASGPSFGFGASSTPASSSLFASPAASSTPASSSLFGTPAASSSPFGTSSVFGSNSGSGFSSNLFGSSNSGAASTTTTSSISSIFFGSSSPSPATPSPAFASSLFGAPSSSSASSKPSFSNLFGSSSSSRTSSSSTSLFSSSVSRFSVSPSPFLGSASPFSTQSAPAFSFPSTAASTAASTSTFSRSSSAPAPSFSTSSTTSSSLFTASSSAAPGFSFPTGSSSSSSSSSAAPGFSFPTGSSSTFASSSGPGFSFPTGSAGVDVVVVVTVEKRDEEALPKPIEVGLVTFTAGLETEAVVADIAEATFPNPIEHGKPDEDEVPKEKPLDEEVDVAEGVGEETATVAELPVPFDIENAGLEPVRNENPGIAELPFPFDSENDEKLDVAEGVGDVSTPGASTVTSGITFPSFGASSSSTAATSTAASSAAPAISFPSFGTPSTAAPPGTIGLSFSLSMKIPTAASAPQPQSAALFGPALTSTAGTTSSTSSAAQSKSTLALASSSGTNSTISAAVTSAPKLPSEITGKTVEEIIKEWNAELQERTGKIQKQATAIAEWDRRILQNCDVLLWLETEVANVVETQTNMVRQLELIETHQEEVDKGLQSMEDEAEHIYKDERGLLLDNEAASMRDAMYEQAEFIERELEQMTEQIKSIIQAVNANQAGELKAIDGMTPLDVAVRILKNQLISLMWIDEKVEDDEDDIPLVAKSWTLAKSCTVTLPVSRPVDHPTATVDEIEDSATCKPTNLTVPIREPTSPHDDCLSLDVNSDVGSEPIIGTAKAPLRSTADSRGLKAHVDVPKVHCSPRVEMESESISPAAHADDGSSGSAPVDCNVAFDHPPPRGNLSDVDFHPPWKDSAEPPSSATEGISVEPSGGAIRDGQVGMTSEDIFHGAIDDPHASESLDFSLLGRFPQAADETAKIVVSPTMGQEMPRGSTSGSAPISTSLPAASTGPTRLSPLNSLKVAPPKPSFDVSGGLASWRGFQVSLSSRESLERLSTKFPQMLDRFQLRTGHFQTFVLDRLASLGDEMHDMLVSDVQETDLDRLKCIISDLSIVGIDISFFRDRLDVIASARRAADLSLTVAMRRHEHAMYTGELLRVESAAKDLRIKLEKMESAAKDLRAILTKNEQARDAAIACLEALDTSAQLDPSLSLDQGLL